MYISDNLLGEVNNVEGRVIKLQGLGKCERLNVHVFFSSFFHSTQPIFMKDKTRFGFPVLCFIFLYQRQKPSRAYVLPLEIHITKHTTVSGSTSWGTVDTH